MIVVDASVVAEVINPAGQRHANVRARIGPEPDWVAPHLIDIEVMSALRKAHRTLQVIDATQFEQLVGLYGQLAIRRVGHLLLLDRIRELSHNYTAYDAAYLALAEALRCPLVTCDGKLARSPSHHAVVEVIT